MPRPLLSYMVRAVSLPIVCALAAAIVIGAPFSAQAEGQSIWIASGKAGGTYRSVYASNLEAQLRSYKLLYRPSAGSVENLNLLAQKKADIALVQADVYAALHRTAPDAAAEMQVVGRLGDECIYVTRRKGGRIHSLSDIGQIEDGSPIKVAVGDPAAGPAASWKFLSALDPNLASAEVDHQGGTLALNQLAVGQFDAALWVTDPRNFDHKMLRSALANDAIEFVEIADDALLQPLPDGTQIYQSKTVKLKDSWRSPKLQTICTSALVLMRADADVELVGNVSDTIALHRNLIVPE